jgi:hypothetical protein
VAWHDPQITEAREQAARWRQGQTLELLKYRAEQQVREAQIASGLRHAEKGTDVSPVTPRSSAFQLRLQETAAIQAAVMGTERLNVRLAAYDPRPRQLGAGQLGAGRPWGEVVVNVMNAERGRESDLARVLRRLVVSAALRQPESGQGRVAALWSAACAMIDEAWFDELGLPALNRDLDPQQERGSELERRSCLLRCRCNSGFEFVQPLHGVRLQSPCTVRYSFSRRSTVDLQGVQ